MSQLNSVWVFSDNPERYAELFGGAQQWGQQVYAIVQNTTRRRQLCLMVQNVFMFLEQNDRAATH
ncbi:putative electron transfer flavoprotein subunit alpha [Escherichia coli]|uniref:Putative electron transfer flavoprotein subunit alpha n=1 Tax=Escherichia coli TaxID=562 RepID=A0A376KUT8_ECOLX|nr:putative electron transfer flavoprotein subunit alpha [Escherichia coli]